MTEKIPGMMPKALIGRRLQKVALVGMLGLTFAGFEAPARASYIQNGTFTLTTGFGATGGGITTGSDYSAGGTITNWTVSDVSGSTGLALLYVQGNQGNATTANDGISLTGRFGAFSVFDPGNVAGSGGAIPNTSPGGGNFIVADGATGYNIAIYQPLTTLTAGVTYAVSFWYAAGQQYTFTGTTTEGWQVSLLPSAQLTVATGAGIQNTPTQAIIPGVGTPGLANGGFQAWAQETMRFTATSSSEVLTFLALGTPSGEPPVDFLSDVVVSPTPEPDTVAMFGIGMVALFLPAGFRRGWFRKNRVEKVGDSSGN